MRQKFKITTTLFALFLILLFTQCSKNKFKVDVSDIKVDLELLRFEQDLFDNKLNQYSEFKSKYGYFIDDYTQGILGFNGDSTTAFQQLMLFKQDQNARKVYDLVQKKYKNFELHEKELITAYRYFKYHFPKENIPKVITCTNNFSLSTMNAVGEGYICIGLDMHMGKDFRPYEFTDIENYWKPNLTPETIAPYHMLAHFHDLFERYNKGENYLDDMLYQGKLLYCLDAVFPDLEDQYKIGFTKEQLNWCKQEEKMIWQFIVKDKYLYEIDKVRYNKLLKEGPKTIAANVPPDAPPMIGKYAGWQLIRQYMDNNKNVTLEQLMKETDSKKILQNSGYKPQ